MAKKRTHPKPRVMRVGKTQRDHETGAWANHQQNQRWRRLESSGAAPSAMARGRRG